VEATTAACLSTALEREGSPPGSVRAATGSAALRGRAARSQDAKEEEQWGRGPGRAGGGAHCARVQDGPGRVGTRERRRGRRFRPTERAPRPPLAAARPRSPRPTERKKRRGRDRGDEKEKSTPAGRRRRRGEGGEGRPTTTATNRRQRAPDRGRQAGRPATRRGETKSRRRAAGDEKIAPDGPRNGTEGGEETGGSPERRGLCRQRKRSGRPLACVRRQERVRRPMPRYPPPTAGLHLRALALGTGSRSRTGPFQGSTAAQIPPRR
jgi:hypothetical protein